MIFPHILDFDAGFVPFTDTSSLLRNILNFYNLFAFFLLDNSHSRLISLNPISSLFETSILNFIDQLEELHPLSNLENVNTIYHYSVPTTKLFYPEPFVAAPSFMHSDLWFVHILIYQYWLWFFFTFIIVFFFVVFVCTLRWCNMRIRPRRETRGVSRSKCGDLITSTVPVSWAASIIITESTDAIDFYEGFGTTELVVGIRAYQWGWEYYYPKDIDLSYNIKRTYSAFAGNSLKYDNPSELVQKKNNLWKFYQNKVFDEIITPAHLLVLPTDALKLLNTVTLADLGSSPLNESVTFKKAKMFSKTPNTLPFHIPKFNNARNQLAHFFTTDNVFIDSIDYGLRRQHNLGTYSINSNSRATFGDTFSVEKWLNRDVDDRFNIKKNPLRRSFSPYFKTPVFALFDESTINFFMAQTVDLFNPEISKLLHFYKYPDLFYLFNRDTNKKKLNYPLYKLFNLPRKTFKLSTGGNLNDFFAQTDHFLTSDYPIAPSRATLTELRKNYLPFAPSNVVLLTDKIMRNFVSTRSPISHHNLSSYLNTPISYFKYVQTIWGADPFIASNFYFSKWADPQTTFKLAANRLYFDYPHPPFRSNNPLLNFKNYDAFENTFDGESSLIFLGKEDLMPLFLPQIYWNFYWSQTAADRRFDNDISYNNLLRNFYLPVFDFYYEYDFKNWQDLYFFENNFWESSMPSYLSGEYIRLSKKFYKFDLIKEDNYPFYLMNKPLLFTDKILSKPLYKNNSLKGCTFPQTMHFDDPLSPVRLLNPYRLSIIPFIADLSSEETYENFKFQTYVNDADMGILSYFNGNFFKPLSVAYVYDFFRPNYEEFVWHADDRNILNDLPNLFKNTDLTVFDESEKLYHLWALSPFPHFEGLNNFKTTRFTNYLNLRAPVRSAIVTYNAIQKVFRARFDEGRSHSKLLDFSKTFDKQAYISSLRPAYEKLLGKNKQNYFKINFYNKHTFDQFNDLYALSSSMNFYYFDFPFLLAAKSDASRYLWFDWFAKWGFYEVQPSSSSKYAIHGAPYSNKMFEFNTQINDVLSETETYLTRIGNARRNYLSNWTRVPFFFIKNLYWYNNNTLSHVFTTVQDSTLRTEAILSFMHWYWRGVEARERLHTLFTPSDSNLFSYGRGGPYYDESAQAYYYTMASLLDTLTRREYLYRQFFFMHNRLTNLPTYLINSPSNPILKEIRALFFFIDPIDVNTEYSRDVYYNSLSFFRFNTTYPELRSIMLNLGFLTWLDYLFYYFFYEHVASSSPNNAILYKNQYRPLKKGISNMIRLHATGAIAMPIEIRLQILASSKDVIHSWAIPSAGIKIDCVPGFSSHKVTMFLVSGIYWGQCMEICGRYHHWMPIIVYFMRRDLFFLWCTHFVFLSGSNNIWTINDRQFVDYVKPVSFDKNSWLSELTF